MADAIIAAFQLCTIHGIPVAGMSYCCPSCHRWFCAECIHFYIASVSACPACGAVAASMQHAGERPGIIAPDLLHVEITIMDPAVIDEMGRLGISDEISDEVLEHIKHIPPDQRVAYLRQIFDGDEINPESGADNF
jgi:hypothetical protein